MTTIKRLVATRAAMRVLIKAGLSEEEVDALFKRIEDEILEGRFATQDQRLKSIETYIKELIEPEVNSARKKTLHDLGVALAGGIILEAILPLLKHSYDQVIFICEKILERHGSLNPSYPPEKNTNLQFVKLFGVQSKLNNASAAILASSLEYFEYYNHAEFLYRAALAYRESTFGKNHYIIANHMAFLVSNLDKQGRSSEADKFHKHACWLVLNGVDCPEMTDKTVSYISITPFDGSDHRRIEMLAVLGQRLSKSVPQNNPNLLKVMEKLREYR